MTEPPHSLQSPAAAEYENQSPPFAGVDLFAGDSALRDALQFHGVDSRAEKLDDFGRNWGSAENFERGRLANECPPILRTVDPRGARFGPIDFHPAYYELMAQSMTAGLHCSTWLNQRHVARAARVYTAYQAEAGHMCPITMTHASAAALRAAPEIAAKWLPKITATTYDPALRPWWEKSAVTLGMGMTERQGGTDVRANTTSATPHSDHYEINGHKWFMSAPMCDAFLVLAQAPGGLTCFLMPRFRPDGSLNTVFFRRLKDKLGNRSNASSEVDFENAYAERIGAEGAGVRTIIEMVQLTRLDCVVASAGLMRFALSSAIHHASHRSVFQKRLIDQPLMRNLIADMALEAEGATALAMRLAAAFDRAPLDPQEAAFARIMTPAIKYYVCKIAPGFVYEAMECHGGNGYVEELPLARAYREAPVNAIWEGSGNVMALDVLRAARGGLEDVMHILQQLADANGAPGQHAAAAIAAALSAPDVEMQGRRIAEMLARLAAAAAIAQYAPAVAEAYATTRLQGDGMTTLGARPIANAHALIERALPLVLPTG